MYAESHRLVQSELSQCFLVGHGNCSAETDSRSQLRSIVQALRNILMQDGFLGHL